MTHDAHIPVLYHEVLQLLRPQRNGRYLDATLGGGGHTAGILQESAPTGRVLAFDRDPEAIAFAQQQLAVYGDRVTYINASYAAMTQLAPANGFPALDGILLDLGLSSRQLESAERGFSFMKDGPLDMRMSQHGESAADFLNTASESAIADVLYQYGEERQSRRVARAIVAARAQGPITRTAQLADVVRGVVRGSRDGIDPATRTFQALR
ncbi:MAG: 16S rRNA (cytosine(1402)-N(4))-methyltransferase RsmH, partial [Anaerolineales bacterium]|nr:16S rRNA (cytosine(1402)-N(4))-methyltransferase RsmH [Anaerolineales bacterium]